MLIQVNIFIKCIILIKMEPIKGRLVHAEQGSVIENNGSTAANNGCDTYLSKNLPNYRSKVVSIMRPYPNVVTLQI